MSDNGQVVRYEPGAKIESAGMLKGLLRSAEGRIAEIMPRHIDPERLLKLALMAANQNPGILECTQESVIQSVMRSAELGLDCSGTLGEAYLVPYYNTKRRRKELQFIPGYRGLVKLARQSGEVKRVEAEVVHENDHFVFRKGSELIVDFRPCLSGNPGEKIGVYALIQLSDGECQAVYMRADEVAKVRSMSKAQGGPWFDWEKEMWKKTGLRRLMKLAPLSSERYQKIIEYDNENYDLQAVKNRVSETEDLNRRLGLVEHEQEEAEPEDLVEPTGDPSKLTDEEKEEYGV